MMRTIIVMLGFLGSHGLLRVCITLDSGFDMLSDESAALSDVTSEASLFGFGVQARQAILSKALNFTSYELRVLPSYGELMVATRKDECDVGWAAFFALADRERCVPNADTCRSLASLQTELSASGTTGTVNWTPWRCCIDYSPAFLHYGMAIVYDAKRVSFFEALGRSITQPFFVNFLCFLFLLVLIFAHAVWLCERGPNAESFPRHYLEGIDDAIW